MKYFVPAIVWFIFIFVACAMPGKDIPHISFLEMLAFDKWVHAGIFFVLVILLMRGMKFAYVQAAHSTTVLFALAIAIPYGGLLEIMQGTLFEDRAADLYDFIANSFGAVCGVFLYRNLAKRIKFLQPQ
jgi:VanZ family protein